VDDDWFFDHVLAYEDPDLPPGAARGASGEWAEWWRRRWLDCTGDPVAERARQQGFVVTVAQLRAFGIAPHDIRRQVRRGRWWQPVRGTVSPVVPDGCGLMLARRRHALVGAAACLRRPGSVVAGSTAATLHGLPSFEVPAAGELITRVPRTSGRRPQALVRKAEVRDDDVTMWFGIPVLTVARTVVEQSRRDRRDGLMAADAALHERLATRAQLAAAAAQVVGRRGGRRATEIVSLGSALAESPLESLVRLALHDDGFPEPALQVVIRDDVRGKTYRVDMLFEEQNVVLEADGLSKYTAADRRLEKLREARLEALGFVVRRVVWEDVVRYWPQTRDRLRRALRMASARAV
jgi:hypothetical protein